MLTSKVLSGLSNRRTARGKLATDAAERWAMVSRDSGGFNRLPLLHHQF
jgi:hypothetical protein